MNKKTNKKLEFDGVQQCASLKITVKFKDFTIHTQAHIHPATTA